MSTHRAVVIGVPQYMPPGVSTLEAVYEDVYTMAAALRNSGYEVRDFDPDDTAQTGRNGILSAYRCACAAPEPAEVLILYFSGHGVHFEGRDYLMPHDVELNDPRMFTDYLIPTDLADVADEGGAETVLFIVDACREGVELVEKKGVEWARWSEGQIQRARRRKFAIVFGCEPAMYCQFIPREKLPPGDESFSVFTRALVEALDAKPDSPTLRRVLEAAEARMKNIGDQYGLIHPQKPRIREERAIPGSVLDVVICEGNGGSPAVPEGDLAQVLPAIGGDVRVLSRDDRRTSGGPRWRCSRRLTLWRTGKNATPVRLRAEMVNISQGGARVAVETRVDPLTRVSFELPRPREPIPIEGALVLGERPRGASRYRYPVGLSFPLRLSEEDLKRVLRKWRA